MIGQIRIDHPILVVDDTNSTRYSTVRILRAAGVEVVEATSGQQALELAPGCGAVVLDVNLPDLDGFEVCSRLRAGKVNARVPVIHLTAQRLRDEDKIRGLETGADAYLTHPVEPGVLVATINALLRARAAEQAELRSRVRFEAMFQTAPVGIALVSAAGELREANTEMYRLFGLAQGDVALEGRMRDVIIGCLPMPDGAGRANTVITASDPGRTVYLDCRVTALDDETRMLIVVDTTLKHLLEAERERLLDSERSARHIAEEASRAKDSFLALLSHELRNPLAPISSAATLLQMAPAQPAVAERASEVIIRQVRHMTELVDDLMDVSRVTRGLVELQRAPVDLGRVVAAAIEQVRPLLDSRAHALAVHVPDEPVVVEGDATRLVQVVANLLNNAAKYTAPRGTLSLELRRNGSEATIRMVDNGVGMPAALLPHVFELFSQAERTPDRSQGGLGIGLALVRSIVQLHGGHVEALSAGEGLGSTFTVVLPAIATPEPGRQAHHQPVVRSQPVGVLLVDDNVDAACMLADVIRLAGHDVHVAHSADDAIRIAQEAGAALGVCILDIGLPGMSGYALLERLRGESELRNAAFVALTGYSQDADREQSRLAGFDEHLVKPVVETELLDIIGALGVPR
ncbi:MAG TPA: response regulator [Lysobacter sp.]|nr:response regulator [Lysobacter sp.]